MKFTINKNVLAALAVTMPKSDIRYYLNGVLIEVHTRELFAVSADGRRLSAYHAIHDATEDVGSVILGADLVWRLIESRAAPDGSKDLSIVTDGNTAICRERCVIGYVVDGKFPDWRSVVAKSISSLDQSRHIDLDPEFVGSTGKQARLLRDPRGPRLCACRTLNSSYGALVGFGRPDFFSFIMEIKTDLPVALPEWAKLPEPQGACAMETA